MLFVGSQKATPTLGQHYQSLIFHNTLYHQRDYRADDDVVASIEEVHYDGPHVPQFHRENLISLPRQAAQPRSVNGDKEDHSIQHQNGPPTHHFKY